MKKIRPIFIDILPSISGLVILLDFFVLNGNPFNTYPLILVFSITPVLAIISIAMATLVFRRIQPIVAWVINFQSSYHF